MPTVRIPLVGTFNQRGLSGSAALTLSQDQRFMNVAFTVVTNPVTGKSVVYAEKRAGWGVDSQVSSGLASTGLIKPQGMTSPISAFGETNSAVYLGTINIGNATGRILHLAETLISASSYVVMKSSDGTGWYYPDGAKNVTSYTGDTISGNFLVTTVSVISDIYPGQLITGGQIGAGARVTSVNVATSTFGLSVAASATSTGAVVTKEPIAKILDSNFKTSVTYQSALVPLDGYLFYATDDGYLNNSALNTVTSYPSANRIAVQQSPDPTVAVAVQKNYVIAFGIDSNEKYQNAGFSSGSPMQVTKSQLEHIGTLDQRSVTTIEDDIYYVSTPSEGDIGVYRMRGLQSTRISTSIVDKILGTASVAGAIYASSFRLNGYPHAAFVIANAVDGPASNLLLESGDILLLEDTPGGNLLLEDAAAQSANFVRMVVYNAGLNIWSEWDCNQATFIDSIGSGTANKLIATSRMSTDGKIYKIDPVADGQLYRDDTSTYSMEIRTAKLDFGTNDKKYVREINLVADTVSSTAVSTCSLYWTDDDYRTWKGPLNFDLSANKKNVHRLGAHYGGRAYRIVHSANGPFRAEAIEITYDKGLS